MAVPLLRCDVEVDVLVSEGICKEMERMDMLVGVRVVGVGRE
jgi:hypothetical protein